MILCSGENLIDIIPTTNSTDYYKACVGGSPLNTAIGLGILKNSVYFFSRISNDFFGEKIINFLHKNNVKTSLVQRSGDPTTIGFIGKKKNPDFSFYANKTADRNLKKYNFSKSIKNKIILAHFSSISLVLKPGSETYFKIMKDLKKDSLISIDPNIRPSLIKNKNNFKKRFNHFLKITDLMKLSEEDFRYIDNKNKPDKIIPKWINKNKIIFIIYTMGKNGSVLYTNKFKINIKAYKVKELDTVGAGDIYQAGMLSYLNKKGILNKNDLNNMSKEDWMNCLNFASKAAAINCMREGCNPPTLNEINNFKEIQK